MLNSSITVQHNQLDKVNDLTYGMKFTCMYHKPMMEETDTIIPEYQHLEFYDARLCNHA